ncbi:MAG: repeat-containing protein [Chthonomonadales bacterium]|nr:repeat-containing protein [Chthonomonadales bacterium]
MRKRNREAIKTLLSTVLIGILLLRTCAVWGEIVGPPLSLEKLTAEADIVLKGTAVSSTPIQDERLAPMPAFAANETQFRIISVLKGVRPGPTVRFRHYDEAPKNIGRMSEPLHYHFDAGRTYIIFAKRSGQIDVYHQLWSNHHSTLNQGVILCSAAKPVSAKTVKEAIWEELLLLLNSPDADSILYSIQQLDQMSTGQSSFDSTQDFDRKETLKAIHPLMRVPDGKVARAAIAVVGSHNPYLTDDQALYWLATVGSAEVPGIGKMDRDQKNTGGEMYRNELIAVADSKANVETRALAIRALGLVRDPLLCKSAEHWLADADPAIRASATLLLAGFPDPETGKRLIALSADPAPEVRARAANGIGFAQRVDAVEALALLLKDKDQRVRESAAMSLLSFSPKSRVVAGIFRDNLGNEEFKPLFLLSLARTNPAPYLDALAQAVELQTVPGNFWGGQIPAFTAWEILFRYLQSQPSLTLRSGKLDRFLDAMEKVGNYSSSEPQDIYAFYLQNGLSARAKKFRSKATRAASYDLDYFFKQVDSQPNAFKRE